MKNWFRNSPATAGTQARDAVIDPPADNQPAIDAIEERDRRFAEGLANLSSTGREDWPPRYADPFPDVEGALPEIPAAALTVELLGGAIAHHGALIIRGLFTPEQVAATRSMQDRVRAISESGVRDRGGWYVPFDGKTPRLKALRSRIESRGGNWLVDSPLGLQQTLQFLEAVGVTALVGEHFGERPVVSLQKCTLRAVAPQVGPTGWHQDGSFLGEHVRSMNLWVALSDCGGSTPAAGMEIVPARLEEILDIPPDLGASKEALDLVAPLLEQHSLVVPEFAAGDGIMFDEKLMHRTAFGPHLSAMRYALECWFFAPSHSAANYSPLLA